MMESHIRVPTMQGHTFSERNRWFECVLAAVARVDADHARRDSTTRIDRTWVVLMALPSALEMFNTHGPSEAISANGSNSSDPVGEGGER